jgi:hypothetical protein
MLDLKQDRTAHTLRNSCLKWNMTALRRHYLISTLELAAATARSYATGGSSCPAAALSVLASPGSSSWQVGLAAQATYANLLKAGWPSGCAADIVLAALLEHTAASGGAFGTCDATTLLAAAAGSEAASRNWLYATSRTVGRLAAMSGQSSEEVGRQGLESLLSLLQPLADNSTRTSLARAVAALLCRRRARIWSKTKTEFAARRDFVRK